MAATALILAGCSNDENGMDNGPVELRLTSGVTAQTRATDTQSTTISSGEVVSVWVDDAGTTTSPLYKRNSLQPTEATALPVRPCTSRKPATI